MLSKPSCAALVVYFLATFSAIASDGLPAVLVSSSPSFDRACSNYYHQGNDPDVKATVAQDFCACVAGEVEGQAPGTELLDFLARTYSEDLTAFIGEYPKGEAWMESYFAAERQCKQNDNLGSNQRPAGNKPENRIEAGSWGGVVREGPGQTFRKLATLKEGDSVKLIENTGTMFIDYPWWKIEFSGGREGYQWGGILCARNAPIEGIYETCQ